MSWVNATHLQSLILLMKNQSRRHQKRISHKQLMEAINVVEGFFVYQHGKDAEEMHLSALKMQAWAIRHHPKSSQASLDQFFVM